MPVERVAIFDCALSTERQAERGRQKLRIYAFSNMPSKMGTSSLFLNREIPFHAEPGHNRRLEPVNMNEIIREMSQIYSDLHPAL